TRCVDSSDLQPPADTHTLGESASSRSAIAGGRSANDLSSTGFRCCWFGTAEQAHRRPFDLFPASERGVDLPSHRGPQCRKNTNARRCQGDAAEHKVFLAISDVPYTSGLHPSDALRGPDDACD